MLTRQCDIRVRKVHKASQKDIILTAVVGLKYSELTIRRSSLVGYPRANIYKTVYVR